MRQVLGSNKIRMDEVDMLLPAWNSGAQGHKGDQGGLVGLLLSVESQGGQMRVLWDDPWLIRSSSVGLATWG